MSKAITSPLVGIIMGSDSDWPLLQKGAETLGEFGVPFEVRVMSAHRTPDLAAAYAAEAEKRGLQMPAGIPVATVTLGSAGPLNAALVAVQILALSNPELRRKLHAYKDKLRQKVAAGDAKVQVEVAKMVG